MQADLVEAFLDLRIEGGSTHYIHLYVSAEGCVQRAAYFVENNFVEKRNVAEYLDCRLADCRFHAGLVDFLHHERNGEHQIWLHSLHRLEKERRGRGFAQEVNAHTAGDRVEEFEYQTVDMCHWQH